MKPKPWIDEPEEAKETTMNTQDDNISKAELEDVEPEENPNEGVLEGMKCPKCGSFGPFGIEVFRWVTVEDSGDTDGEGGDTTWEDASPCRCTDCDKSGTVADFTEKEPNITDADTSKPSAEAINAELLEALKNRYQALPRSSRPIWWADDEAWLAYVDADERAMQAIAKAEWR